MLEIIAILQVPIFGGADLTKKEGNGRYITKSLEISFSGLS
jgi:hypothetical protein